MQQPPRPGMGSAPGGAPGSRRPPPPSAQAQHSPGYSPPAPAAPPVIPARGYGSLRLLAGACTFSAWLTLILSVLFGLAMLAAPTPSAMPGLPPAYPGSPDAGDLGLSPSPGAGQLGPLLGMLLPGLKWIGVVTTLGGGLLSFFFLAALGQGIYLLLDMEENTRLTAQALVQIARRQGG